MDAKKRLFLLLVLAPALAEDVAGQVQDTVSIEVVDVKHEVPEAARAELAPNGTLRAGMNLDNTLFTIRDPSSGELSGVSVDIMRELASRLDVPVGFVVHTTPGQVADSAEAGTWDVALLAIEESRAETIAFSSPLTEIAARYIVRKDSSFQSTAQVDSSGVRIAAPDRSGYERFLTRILLRATLVRTQNIPASVELFNAGGADALAGLEPILLEALATMPDARLLDGRFMTVNHGLGTPRGQSAAAEYLEVFVRELVASGFVARAIERHGVPGLAAVE
jgi:polar amino acid transport system substrate-binding protein